ncbi:amino acid adenylation domain-containing protein [Mucilaginibacter sp. RCC_168]|uniref:amino acid adenylation domain-containing protein n=1 Tax=Mucilaginibacter sp. RCC_168 TaxID=3239221 RepID=UPI0035263C97
MENHSFKENVLYNLAKITKGKSANLFQFFGLPEDEFNSLLPSTKLQRNIYVDSLLSDDPSSYNVAEWVEYNESFDVDRWKSAIHFVTKNEPLLRTGFVERDSLIYQAEKKLVDPEIIYEEMSEDSPSRESVISFLTRLVRIPFDILNASSLIRHAVVKTGENSYCLLYMSHQLCSDVRTSKLFFERTFRIYQNLVNDIPLKDYEPKAFTNYVFYNNDRFDTPEILNFWKGQLSSCQNLMSNSVINNSCEEFVSRKLIIDRDRLVDIQQYCIEKDITMSFYFKIISGILLNYILNPGNSFIFFENVHGRSKEDLSTLGLFFHSVPVKINLDETIGLTSKKYVDYYRRYWKDFESYSEVSFDALNALSPQNGLNIIYNYLNQGIIRTPKGNSNGNVIENQGNRNEVQFVVENKKDTIELSLHYYKSFFSEFLFLERFMLVSDMFINDTNEHVEDFSFLLENEPELLAGFNPPKTEIPQTLTFNTIFQEQVIKYSKSIAVGFEETEWDYQMLNNNVNKLAACFQEVYHVIQGDFVGVAMERSHYTLAAIMAIFKLGAVYLPIDQDLPEERIDHIIYEANPKLIIIASKMINKMAGKFSNLFVIDLQLKKLPEPSKPIEVIDDNSNTAYVIYTSGSTGKPKGVLVEHLGMINHLMEKVKDLSLTSSSVIAQTANVGFDISIWQFLAALLVGGKTQIYSSDLILNISEFTQELSENGVTVLEVVPSYLSLMVAMGTELPVSMFSRLQYLLLTGDVLNPNLVKLWFQKFPQIPLLNAYGPTEASDDITHYLMHKPPGYKAIPIGKPLNNITIYIVDNRGRLCPVGIKGEIYVSGISVGKGYLKDPIKTGESFISDPFTREKDCRLYKTGDFGAWLPDGNIIFYGRKDKQVKIRGNRIETGEVESVLFELDGIKEAVVLTKANDGGERILVAFMQLTGDMSVNSIKKYLSQKLPSYMIPSELIQISDWPLTANGKVDREQLLQISGNITDREFIPPSNATEEKLVEIWSAILGLESISIKDSFFDLGGHSLKAMQVVSRVHELFDVKIDIKLIFANPTIEELAIILDAKSWVKTENNESSNELFL